MEEYLKTLLEQVRCKEAHSYIETEIRMHIEDQIATNLANGMPEDVAVEEAIRDMGSPVESGIALDKIHRPAIAWDMVMLMGLISILGIMIHLFIGASAPGSGNFAIHTLLGFIAMLIVYRLDYSLISTYAKFIAFGIILIEYLAMTTPFGVRVNGLNYYFSFGGFHLSIFSFMMLYVPLYGALIYQYYGTGYKGIAKSFLWMILPCFLALRIPSLSLAMILFVSMAIILSITIYKGWFKVAKKKFLICFWSFLVLSPILFLASVYGFHWLQDYQEMRLTAFLTSSGDAYYVTNLLCDFLSKSQFVGGANTAIMEKLPDFNSSYIFTYLTSSYGIIAGAIVCLALIFLIFKIFKISLKQRNQLGMIIGCGCGTVILVNSVLNILQNLGLMPVCQSFLPFFSSGGSCIIVSYIMMGIILSIYRYKNIFPIHFDRTSRMTFMIKVEKKNAV